ncbi:MAG TPA: hypothetical protein VFN74_21360 [Chloroflexota bacterium]|nr:hypothetical protein [Chloroflexota bacterium]
MLERQLFKTLEESVQPFLERYCHPDGTLIWGDTLRGRDGADDFYESAYNWPLLYLLGGGDDLLPLSVRQWEAITRQVSALKPVPQIYKEYERGYDWFHQGESNLYFYFLCLADPERREHGERAGRFAGFYLNEDPEAPNYDAERKLIRAPHNGSGGPRWGFTDAAEPRYGWSAGMARYGLPFTDVPGVAAYDDLKDPEAARRMGVAMQERMGRGDVAANMAATGLLANAYALTGEEKYRRWVVEYVEAWLERARKNGGLVPDNVGLSGEVGEYTGGKWYGGLYGWTWPHGFYNIAMAALVAASSAVLVTGDLTYLELARGVIDRVWELGEERKFDPSTMSLREHWVGQRLGLERSEVRRTFLVPFRNGDAGWFDWQPMAPTYPAALWATSLEPADWERIERLRRAEAYDWRHVYQFRSKEDAGHEAPWLRFLAGANPDYPEQILRASLGVAQDRVEKIRADTADLTTVNIHHWQQHNPVTTEALVQLTLGAPSPVYNGGLLHAPLRYFDARRRRPGLPEDVAALVTRVTAEAVTLDLVNLSETEEREVVVQAGTFGEHRFESAEAEGRRIHLGGRWVVVALPPRARVELRLETARYVNRPTYAAPWAAT